MIEAIRQGYEMGLAAKPFLAQKWEAAWDRPLAEWRKDLGVEVSQDMPVGRVFRGDSSDLEAESQKESGSAEA